LDVGLVLLIVRAVGAHDFSKTVPVVEAHRSRVDLEGPKAEAFGVACLGVRDEAVTKPLTASRRREIQLIYVTAVEAHHADDLVVDTDHPRFMAANDHVPYPATNLIISVDRAHGGQRSPKGLQPQLTDGRGVAGVRAPNHRLR
jgi:hypothetical protein